MKNRIIKVLNKVKSYFKEVREVGDDVIDVFTKDGKKLYSIHIIDEELGLISYQVFYDGKMLFDSLRTIDYVINDVLSYLDTVYEED